MYMQACSRVPACRGTQIDTNARGVLVPTHIHVQRTQVHAHTDIQPQACAHMQTWTQGSYRDAQRAPGCGDRKLVCQDLGDMQGSLSQHKMSLPPVTRITQAHLHGAGEAHFGLGLQTDGYVPGHGDGVGFHFEALDHSGVLPRVTVIPGKVTELRADSRTGHSGEPYLPENGPRYYPLCT